MDRLRLVRTCEPVAKRGILALTLMSTLENRHQAALLASHHRKNASSSFTRLNLVYAKSGNPIKSKKKLVGWLSGVSSIRKSAS